MTAPVVRHLPGLSIADRRALEQEAARFEREGGPAPGPRAVNHSNCPCHRKDDDR